MKKGSILFHKEFSYKNGEIGEKLLVLLNEPKTPSEPYLFCRVTSQEKDKPKQPGCIPNLSLFFISERNDYFSKDTWLQLYDIYPFNAASVLQDSLTKKMIVRGNLKSSTIKNLMACISLIKDIETKYKNYILGSSSLLNKLSKEGKFRIKNK